MLIVWQNVVIIIETSHYPHQLIRIQKWHLQIVGKDEKLRLTNLEWGVDFLRLTNLVKTSLDGQI